MSERRIKSDQQARVERVKAMLKRDPARERRLRVQWDKACQLLAPYFVAAKLKQYEVHMILERARHEILIEIERGTTERHLWIYAMHAAKRPAAPMPKRRTKV